MKIKVYTLDAFAEEAGGGNPAGVVLEDCNLDSFQMQKIAKEVGFSETAFVSKSQNADYRVRFFTPTDEVDLCGHATIGTFGLLHQLGKIQTGSYTQETKAGILEVKIEDNTVIMEQNKPSFIKTIDKDNPEYSAIAKSLNLAPDDLGLGFMEIVSTGLADLLVCVKSAEVLDKINPNFEEIAEISGRNKITGYHVFALTKGEATAQCRNFAPLVGIDEEAATGSSSGALGSFLVKHQLVGKGQSDITMKFLQGLAMGRPSRISARIIKDEMEIKKVFVGGKTSNIQTMEVSL